MLHLHGVVYHGQGEHHQTYLLHHYQNASNHPLGLTLSTPGLVDPNPDFDGQRYDYHQSSVNEIIKLLQSKENSSPPRGLDLRPGYGHEVSNRGQMSRCLIWTKLVMQSRVSLSTIFRFWLMFGAH